MGGDFPSAFAIGTGETGTVTPFGSDPTELVLLDPDCAETDRLAWDGSAAGVQISEPGTLTAVDGAGADATTIFVEYWECTEGAFGAEPEPGTALPEAGGSILILNADGSSFVLDVASATITRLGEAINDTFDAEHTWSPDGTLVAFSRTGTDFGTSDILVGAVDGSDAELLVQDAGAPRWSPDGTHILPAGELRIVNTDGSGLRTLADAAPFAAPPAWSPDGSRLAFVGLPPGANPNAFDLETVISVHDLDSGETTVLAAVDGAGLAEPVWSPDGETIAFTIMSSGMFGSTGALATVPATGGDVTRVVEAPATYYATPLWSPDGEWLSVTRSDDNELSGSLIAVRPDGTDETVLATGFLAATAWRADVGE